MEQPLNDSVESAPLSDERLPWEEESEDDDGKLNVSSSSATVLRPSPPSPLHPPFTLVYALDPYGVPIPRPGRPSAVLELVDLEEERAHARAQGGSRAARSKDNTCSRSRSMDAGTGRGKSRLARNGSSSVLGDLETLSWRKADEDEHQVFPNDEGLHSLFVDASEVLCYLDESTHTMRLLPREFKIKSDIILTRSEIAKLYLGFLEVATTTILYHRRVYPINLFEPARMWRADCFASKTIALARYVGGLVDALAEDFVEGTTRRIAIALRDASEKLLERYVLEFSQISHLNPPSLRELESALRSSLTHLNGLAEALPLLKYKGQARFSVLDADRPEQSSLNAPISTADSAKTASSTTSETSTRRTLVYKIETGFCDMSIYLEQFF